MGPNLRRLFAESKHIDRYDGTDDVEICAADAAVHKLRDMFDTHGEALIRMLEELEANPTDGRRMNARTLLAQLEAEAQP